ncbi:MAG: hypothetical protein IPH78_09955 [Bacteroidetes bacterium]|nr:hypothetical protein [Bacteroidota bacterium]
MHFPVIIITQEMIEEAQRKVPSASVQRTVASRIDTLTGHIGEFAFAQYLYGDWRKNSVGSNKGQSDFGDFEIKASSFPFNTRLNLLVREDYAQKRKPKFYVQIILDVKDTKASEIFAGTSAFLCGYATCEEVDAAPLKDFGSKLSDRGGYRCHYISITKLHAIEELKSRYLKDFK